jgi:predicted amidophosphoribosyltransferase
MTHWLERGWNALWECLGPRTCAACAEDLDDQAASGQLCRDCLALCEPCPRDVTGLPPHAPRCLSAFVYEGALATAMQRLKWQGRDDLARPLGQLLSPLLAEVAQTCDWLVPVPLHPQRLRLRGYNQATLLAREARRACPSAQALRLHPGLLTTTRATAPAHQLGRQARFLRVESQFSVPRGMNEESGRLTDCARRRCDHHGSHCHGLCDGIKNSGRRRGNGLVAASGGQRIATPLLRRC